MTNELLCHDAICLFGSNGSDVCSFSNWFHLFEEVAWSLLVYTLAYMIGYSEDTI